MDFHGEFMKAVQDDDTTQVFDLIERQEKALRKESERNSTRNLKYSGSMTGAASKSQIKSVVDYNGRNENGETPLILASKNSNEELVRLFLGMPLVNPNLSDHTGNTALICAALNNDTNILWALIANHAFVNCVNSSLDSPLIMACKKGNFGSAKILVEQGASISSKNIEGETAISICKANGFSKIYDYLVKEDAKSAADIPQDANENQELQVCVDSSYGSIQKDEDDVVGPNFNLKTSSLFSYLPFSKQKSNKIVKSNQVYYFESEIDQENKKTIKSVGVDSLLTALPGLN